MEEASSDTPKKRRPEDLLDQDLQHPASKSKRSLETKRSEEEGKSSNEICGQDLLQEGKILEPKLVDDEEEVKGNIKSQTIEIEEEEGDGGGVDLISSLPNDALNTIVSKLNTKEGARTQILAKRWKPIWYSSPLNLQVDDGLATQERRRISIVDKILSNHTGGGRRLYLHNVRIRSLYDKFDSWFESPALNNLEELDFCYRFAQSDCNKPLLPLSALRFSSTLAILCLGNCHFPMEGAHPIHFPKLKHISLCGVTISENVFHSLLSGSPVLESLLILDCNGLRKVCIQSTSIRSIGVRACFFVPIDPEVMIQELVIVDVPCLQRLLTYPQQGPSIIKVYKAPKLEVLGYISNSITRLEIGSMIFKEMIPTVQNASICTVKVLVIRSTTGPNLGAVLNMLKCFPCLETFYLMISEPRINVADTQYDNLPAAGSIHCLGQHLNKIVIRGYQGRQADIDFANFFLVNARVLRVMKIVAPRMISEKWMANQRKSLLLDYKASKDAEIHFTYCYLRTEMDCGKRTHDLSVSDPFDM